MIDRILSDRRLLMLGGAVVAGLALAMMLRPKEIGRKLVTGTADTLAQLAAGAAAGAVDVSKTYGTPSYATAGGDYIGNTGAGAWARDMVGLPDLRNAETAAACDAARASGSTWEVFKSCPSSQIVNYFTD